MFVVYRISLWLSEFIPLASRESDDRELGWVASATVKMALLTSIALVVFKDHSLRRGLTLSNVETSHLALVWEEI